MKALKLILTFLTDNMIYFIIVAAVFYFSVPWEDVMKLLQKVLSINL